MQKAAGFINRGCIKWILLYVKHFYYRPRYAAVKSKMPNNNQLKTA